MATVKPEPVAVNPTAVPTPDKTEEQKEKEKQERRQKEKEAINKQVEEANKAHVELQQKWAKEDEAEKK